MSFADSNRARISAVAEVTHGTTPTGPTMQILRVTSSDLTVTKETVVSDELRSDRMVADMSEVAASSGGSIGIELSLGTSFKDLFQSALGGTLGSAVAINATDIAATGTGFTTVAESFAGLLVGQWIYVSGFTNPLIDGWYRVDVITGTDTLTTYPSPPATEAATASVTIKGQILRNGTTLRSYSIEQAFLDIGQYMLFRGQRVGGFNLEVSAGAIVTGAFQFMGTQAVAGSSAYGTAYTAATSTAVVNATSNVGAITESDATLATALRTISLTLDNGLRNQPAIGTKFPAGIGQGRQTVTGSVEAYFENLTLFNKFLNHTDASLSFPVADAAGNRLRITLPKIKFGTSNPVPSGIDQDVTETLDFQALYDADTLCQIQLDFIAA